MTDWSRQVSKGLGCGTKMTQICHKSFLPTNALAAYGTENCRRMRQHIFTELYPLAGDLAARYIKTAEHDSYEQANQELQNLYHELHIADLNLCADNPELLETARKLADKCDTARQRTLSLLEAFEACRRIVSFYQIKPPTLKEDNFEAAINRMCSSRWWHRRIQILRLRKIETIARN